MDAIWVRTHPYGAPYVCARSRSGLRGRRASSQHQYIGARPHPGPMVKNMIPRQRSRPRPRAYSASIWTRPASTWTSGRGRAPPNRGVQSRIGPKRTATQSKAGGWGIWLFVCEILDPPKQYPQLKINKLINAGKPPGISAGPKFLRRRRQTWGSKK